MLDLPSVEAVPQEIAEPKRQDKSPLLILLTFGILGATLLLEGWRLLPVLGSAENFMEACVLTAFVSLLVVFWTLGAYYIALVILFVRHRSMVAAQGLRAETTAGVQPPVAILYPTCDDFQSEAVMSCLGQDYSDYHVFLLDDSRSESFQKAVDRFAGEHPERVTVVRRSDRGGYKAGNLNHGLRTAAAAYPFFAVLDADEKLPPHFLSTLVGRMTDEDCAFVQANHAPNPEQKGAFPRAMGQTILPFWQVLLSTKHRYGFVPCVGHGLVVRRAAWEKVGGFPEVASEDLAFSSALLEIGLRGSYAEDVVCYEDFPESVASFKKQQQRYAAGVFQALIRHWPRLLKSRHATWIEKLDFGLTCLPLYVPVFGLLFMLTVGVGFGLCFGRWNIISADTRLGHFSLPYLQTFDGRFQSLWGAGFVFLSILFSFSPSLPMLTLALYGRIRRPFQLMAVSNVVYMSTIFVTCRSLMRMFLRRSVQFLPTGSITKAAGTGNAARLPVLMEGILALLLSALLLSTLNLGLGVVALAPLVVHSRWLRLVSYAMFAGVLAQVFLSATLSFAPWGISQFVFSIHF